MSNDSKAATNSARKPSAMKELRIFTEEGINVPYERITYEEIQRDPVLREKCKNATALIESFKLEYKPEFSDESAHEHLNDADQTKTNQSAVFSEKYWLYRTARRRFRAFWYI